MEEIFAYVLEFMLTFDKMKKPSPLMFTKFEIWGWSILKVIQALHTIRIVLYIGSSDPVVGSLTATFWSYLDTRLLNQNTCVLDVYYFSQPDYMYNSTNWHLRNYTEHFRNGLSI